MNTRHYYLRLLRTFALATLTAAATAACSDDNDREPLTPPDGNGGIPVTFTADINPGSDADPDTRTALKSDGNGGFTVTWKGKDNNPTSGYDKIHIWAAQGTTTIGSKTYVPTTSTASSALEPRDNQNPLTLTEAGDWAFTAVYGTGIFTRDNHEPIVTLSYLSQSEPNNTDHIAAQDFSVATATQTVEANSDMPQSINLQFKHKLSALQLQVKNGTDAELTVSEIRLAIVGDKIAGERYFDVIAGDWKTGSESKGNYLTLAIDAPAELTSGGTESQDFHMLLFPGYANTDMTITVITNRGEYTLTQPAPTGGFIAGKNYKTDITIKSSNLDPDKETWTDYTVGFDTAVNKWTPVDNGIIKTD